MPKAQTKASAKYNAKAYEEIKLRVSKGQKEQIQAYAQEHGESLNGYINRLIAEDMGARLTKPEKDNAITSKKDTDISEIDLSVRAFNAAKRAGINTLNELTDYLSSDKCIFDKEGRLYQEFIRTIKEYKQNN